MDRWVSKWTMDGWMDTRMEGCIDRRVDGWMDVWMDGMDR